MQPKHFSDHADLHSEMSYVKEPEISTQEANEQQELMASMTEIVASYVSHNTIDATQLSEIIQSVYGTLRNLSVGQNSHSLLYKKAKIPACPIKKSVTDDYIICLEDGKRLKMLKRYLRTVYKMTPDQYRARWGLDPSYPMVSPNYAKKRSNLARSHGLGLGRGGAGSLEDQAFESHDMMPKATMIR